MDITTIIATNAIAVAAVGFLLKLWVDKRLSHALNSELEKFKTELAKEVSLYSIQSTWNHSKKMELLGELYEHMVEADFELKSFFMNIKIKNKENIDIRASNFCEKYLELNAHLHKNELFLDEVLVGSVRDTYKPFYDLSLEAMDKGFEYEKFGDGLPDDIDGIFGVGDIPRKRVLKSFREAAGINA